MLRKVITIWLIGRLPMQLQESYECFCMKHSGLKSFWSNSGLRWHLVVLLYEPAWSSGLIQCVVLGMGQRRPAKKAVASEKTALIGKFCIAWYTIVIDLGRWTSPINGILQFSSRFSCDIAKLLSAVIAMRHNNFLKKQLILESVLSSWIVSVDDCKKLSAVNNLNLFYRIAK